MTDVPRSEAPAAPWMVESAVETDAEAIATLLASCMADGWSEAMVAQSLEHGATGLLVRDPGEQKALLACCLVRITTIEVEILQLAVAPASRRRGLGDFMLRASMSECVRRGVRAAFLEVHAGNAAARALYRVSGFAEVGIRARYYRDGGDAILMRRDLSFPLPPG